MTPPSPTPPRSGGQLLADALAVHGVDTVFGVPGESYLAVLDGLYSHREAIRFITCRHEGSAAFMAEAYGKLTGRPAVLMVTRGPGASNATIGIHTAQQDSTPLVVFVGQVGNDFMGREAFQEVDYRRMFGSMAKWATQIDRTDRIPEIVAHAFQVATSGRMGPVVVALPEDTLSGTASVADSASYQPVQAHPSPAQIETLRELLAAAQRPLVIAGGSGWTPAACEALRIFAEANALPVACSFRRQDLIDHHHPNYVGDVGIGVNPKLAERVRHADLLIAIGPRLGEMTTSGYTLLESPRPRQRLVHVHPGAEELGSVFQAELMINAGVAQFTAALAGVRIEAPRWRASVGEARAELDAWRARPAVFEQPGLDRLDLWEVVETLQRAVPADTNVTNGAGNFATWAHRFWRYGGLRTQLAPTSGAMGYGIPAAVAARIAAPERNVICFAGDGDFLMSAAELATAAQYDAGFLVLLFNNGMYGTIRMHQERDFPGRVSGTDLVNPDFARYAEAFGGFGTRVERTADFGPALEQALGFIGRHKRPALIELAVDPQVITPGRSLDQIAGR